MARVKNTFPLAISDLKTAFGLSGTYRLRDFIAGGAYANTNTANETGGWTPTSGTLSLSQLRGATNLNVTFSGSNTEFSVLTTDAQYANNQAIANATIMVYANGVIQLFGIGTYEFNTTVVPTNLPANSWLQRGFSAASSNVAGMYEVLFVKTAGDATAGFSSNNTWLRLDTNRQQTIIASASGGDGNFESRVIHGRMKFRRQSDSVELANVYVKLDTYAESRSGPYP